MKLLTVITIAAFFSISALWAEDEATRLALQRLVGDARYGVYQENSEGSNSETDGVQDPTVTLEAGQANGKGTISWRPKTDCDVTDVCWALKLAAPTDSSSEITDFVTLDGLAKDLTVGFNMRRTFAQEGGLEGFFDVLDSLCEALGLASGCDNESIQNKVKESTNAELAALMKMHETDPRQLRAATRLLRRATSAFFVNGRLSHNQYKFFTPEAQKHDTNEIGASLKVGYSRVAGSSGRVAFGVGVQRAFKPQETKAQSCTAVEGSEILESCSELPVGAPAQIDSLIAQVEYAHRTRVAAIRPLVSFDFELDVWALDLPFYFLRDDKKAFTGGFRVGWRSDKDLPVASIFVAKQLDWR